MTYINDYTKLDVATANQAVVVAADGTSVAVGTQNTTQILYLLALVNLADNTNNAKIAAQINLMQAKNSEQRKVAGLLVGLQSITATGTISKATITTALKSSLSSFNMTDADIEKLYKTATGSDLAAISDTTLALHTSNAKTYSQNLLGDTSVLQSQLDNYTNLRSSYTESMTSLLKVMKEINEVIVRNI